MLGRGLLIKFTRPQEYRAAYCITYDRTKSTYNAHSEEDLLLEYRLSMLYDYVFYLSMSSLID
jgi:hypothetical protein